MNRRLFRSLEKLAADPRLAPKPQHLEKLDEHFSTPGTAKWKAFKSALRSSGFVAAVKQDLRSDPKLKRFSDNVGRHMQARKVPVFEVPSSSGPREYRVKYHHDVGRFSCNCGDWTYKRSVQTRGSEKDCKHVRMIKSQLGALGKRPEDLTKTATRGRAARRLCVLLES